MDVTERLLIDERLALALGYKVIRATSHPELCQKQDMWYEMPGTHFIGYGPPAFCIDRNLCAKAEAEIARRGLLRDYGRALENELDEGLHDGDGVVSWSAVAKLAMLSPDARVRAILEVLSH